MPPRNESMIHAAPPRPIPSTPLFHAIHAELVERDQWVLWDYQWKPPTKSSAGKWTKVLKRANGDNASTTDRKTWISAA